MEAMDGSVFEDMSSTAPPRTNMPHSPEAEAAVVGGLMLAGDSAFDNIASLVRQDDFF